MQWSHFLFISFGLSFILPYLPLIIRKKSGYFLAAWWLIGLSFSNLPDQLITQPWSNQFNIHLSFIFDSTTRLFLGLIGLVGSAVFVYAQAYLSKDSNQIRFFQYLTFFTAAMLGVVTANSFLLSFIFWELTSFSSYLLIGYYHQEEKSRKSALQALLITGAGGLVLFAGLMALQWSTGIADYSSLTTQLVAESPYLTFILICILIGGLTKSAQFPFHFWLPNAMAAPAPVSAFLHSATMVKAGIYLFMRLDPVFNSFPIWYHTLTVLGGFTLLFAAWQAYQQTDLKKLLAYTTVATLGALTFLIGNTHPQALIWATFLILAHGFYKATLFMQAGLLEKVAGTRDITKIHLRFAQHKGLAIVGILAGLSMLGFPPTLGFLSKEIILTGYLSDSWSYPLWIFSLSLMGAIGLLVGVKPFLKNKNSTSQKDTVTLGILYWGGPLMLALSGIVMAFNPWGLLQKIIPANQDYSIHLWHGWNWPLLTSLLIVIFSIMGLKLHPRILQKSSEQRPWADQLFNQGLDYFFMQIKRLTDQWQNGSLNSYLILFLLAILPIGFLLGGQYIDVTQTLPQINQPSIEHYILLVVMLIATGLSSFSQHRLTAIVSMGGVGFSIAVFYVLLGAPDLALTQIIVETLSVILFVFLLHKVPLLRTERNVSYQLFTGLLAIATGVLVSFFTWQSLVTKQSLELANYFKINSYILANGKNIVNVILVDFRGFDTFGEITVLSIALIVITALFFKNKTSKGVG